jgi:hypothetical protein
MKTKIRSRLDDLLLELTFGKRSQFVGESRRTGVDATYFGCVAFSVHRFAGFDYRKPTKHVEFLRTDGCRVVLDAESFTPT